MSKKPLAIDASTVLATKDKTLAAVSGHSSVGRLLPKRSSI